MSESSGTVPSLFGSADMNPYPAIRRAVDEGTDDADRAALLSLVMHAEHGDDLRHFQSIRDALEGLRDELMCGIDLPAPSLDGIARLVDDFAQPPEVARSEIPAPAPLPMPDAREFAEELLDLSVNRRSPSS